MIHQLVVLKDGESSWRFIAGDAGEPPQFELANVDPRGHLTTNSQLAELGIKDPNKSLEIWNFYGFPLVNGGQMIVNNGESRLAMVDSVK